MDLRIAITDDLNSEREKLSSAIIAPFSKVGLNVGNIDEYTSGEELLRQFSAGRYDLIFLDIYGRNERRRNRQTYQGAG